MSRRTNQKPHEFLGMFHSFHCCDTGSTFGSLRVRGLLRPSAKANFWAASKPSGVDNTRSMSDVRAQTLRPFVFFLSPWVRLNADRRNWPGPADFDFVSCETGTLLSRSVPSVVISTSQHVNGEKLISSRGFCRGDIVFFCFHLKKPFFRFHSVPWWPLPLFESYGTL